MQWLSLIEEVRKRPYIWEYIHSKSRIKTDILWNEVANSLGLDVKICKNRWTQLRNSYTKAKNRLREYVMWMISIEIYDPKRDYGPKWIYYKHLQFLDRSTRPNLSGTDSDEENVEIEIEHDDNDSDNIATSSKFSENANNDLHAIDNNENNLENSCSKENISQKSYHIQNNANKFYENPDQLMTSPIAIKIEFEDDTNFNINAIPTQYVQNLERKIPSEPIQTTTFRSPIKREIEDGPYSNKQYAQRQTPVDNSVSPKRSRFHNRNTQMAENNEEDGHLNTFNDDCNTECINVFNDLKKKPNQEMLTNVAIKIENDIKPDLTENDSSTQNTKFLNVEPESKEILNSILSESTTRQLTENAFTKNTPLNNWEKESDPSTTSTITIKKEIDDRPYVTDKDLSNQHDSFQGMDNVHIKKEPVDKKND